MKRVNVNVEWKCKSVCHDKQRWNNDKCKCECKESVDKGTYDKGFI